MSLYTSQSLGEEPISHNTNDRLMLKKRNNSLAPVDPDRITGAIKRHCEGLSFVEPERITDKVVNGIFDGMSTTELDQLIIQVTAMLIGEEPEYSKLSARLLAHYVDDEVRGQGINCFTDSVRAGHENGLLPKETLEFVLANAEALNSAADHSRSDLFEYFGLRTVYDRYLLKNPDTRLVFEDPQYFFLRVACGLARTPEEAIEFYQLISSFEYMPSTPTLFNSATIRPQMSSCYLLDSPSDSLEAIYDKYKDVALLSKFAGGIGLGYSRVRSQGSLIKGTNGKSNGVVPFLKTLDSSVSAVNQGGKRKGAACIYLETWHADLLDFLKLRDNTGDESMRTHNLNLANWIPDLFMKRVGEDGMWSLFDPSDTPHFTDLYGDEFEKAYAEAEAQGLAKASVKARDIYADMMKCLAQTGNGWMTFKDTSNKKANQIGPGSKDAIHLSNLCTEILEVTSKDETAVCNLGSINLAKYVKGDDIDYDMIRDNVRIAVRYLDRVVDINFYPIKTAEQSNKKWRPVGLGIMGLQDVFFKLKIPFDSPKAREISRRVQENIYFAALDASCNLAKEEGTFDAYKKTKTAAGMLQFDLWDTKHEEVHWQELRARIEEHGLRNSLLIAIAPTATIASICGSYECIEPQVSNLFKRETLSGEFLQINNYLVRQLKELGIWNQDVRNQIKAAEGSVQAIDGIPDDVKETFRTVWEVPMRSLIDMAADRGPYIDQSQSLNLFMENPNIAKLSSMYNYAWKKGLKTTYYLRSRSATRINKATVSGASAVACSLENPETCEACQ